MRSSVEEFCQWARARFGQHEAEQYIRQDIPEDNNEFRERMVRAHFAVWAEFIVKHAARRLVSGE